MDNTTYIILALLVVGLLLLLLRKNAQRKPPSPSDSAPDRAVEAQPTLREAEPKSSLSDASPSARTPAPRSGQSRPLGEQAVDGEHEPTSGTQAAGRGVPSPDSTRFQPSVRPATSERDIAELRKGLSRNRDSNGFFGRLKSLFTRDELSPELIEQIEEVLLSSDVGVATTAVLLERLRAALDSGAAKDETTAWRALRDEILALLRSTGGTPGLHLQHQPTVVLMVGVNGAGKTTTIGKLATQLKAQGKVCVLAAGDTFRAAAVQQLSVWGQRVGCEVVKGKDGSDPGSVLFEAIKKAQQIGADVVLADTAGRLHTKTNLMSEMQKIARTAGKALQGAPHEVLLVIDATNGQNALAQAKEFKESLELSGIVLTKLDGTAKGGVILGIAHSLQVPVRYVGLGERPDDLHPFVPEDFVEALLGKEG